MTNRDDIKKALKDKKAVIGTNSVIKNLRLGKLVRVYVTLNCPNTVKEDIERYSDLAKTEIVKLKISNDSLGTLCKKPFSVSLLGIMK